MTHTLKPRHGRPGDTVTYTPGGLTLLLCASAGQIWTAGDTVHWGAVQLPASAYQTAGELLMGGLISVEGHELTLTHAGRATMAAWMIRTHR